MRIKIKIQRKEMSRRQTFVLALFLALFLAANVFYVVGIATSGAEIAALENKEKTLTELNQELKGKIIDSSSLSSLNGSAETLGFAKATSLWYLKQGEAATAKLP